MLLRCAAVAVALVAAVLSSRMTAQIRPSVVDSGLQVSTVVDNLSLPTAMAFLGEKDFLVLEKNSGVVWRVQTDDGVPVKTQALDLPVNYSSERGLLGIAVHPDFEKNRFVYLFWTCVGAPPPPSDPWSPVEARCAEQPTGIDSGDLLAVPLLGNRVDRFVFDPATSRLTFDRNLIMLRAFQNDGAPTPVGQGDELQPARGNHDSGVLAFGPDRKLYIIVGDVGRRGWLQNLRFGPTSGSQTVADDQFGGPEPDDAHFTGVILRLNDDGTTPEDNPLRVPPDLPLGPNAAEVNANIRKTFVYGIRNSFGMAFDPVSGNLWYQSNGEDAYDEINRAIPGLNEGWIQLQGPAARVADYRQIETTSLHHEDFPNLQQFRWGPELIATTPLEARSRLVMLSGARYKDPEYSWRHVVAPAGLGFLDGDELEKAYAGDMFVGLSEGQPLGGTLLRFKLNAGRTRIAGKTVCDNTTYHVFTGCEETVFGTNFGAITDVKTAPNGTLWVVSLTHGAVYAIHKR